MAIKAAVKVQPLFYPKLLNNRAKDVVDDPLNRSFNRNAIATLAREGGTIINLSCILRLQCTFEIERKSSMLQLHDMSRFENTNVFDDDAKPTRNDHLFRTTHIQKGRNSIIGMDADFFLSESRDETVPQEKSSGVHTKHLTPSATGSPDETEEDGVYLKPYVFKLASCPLPSNADTKISSRQHGLRVTTVEQHLLTVLYFHSQRTRRHSRSIQWYRLDRKNSNNMNSSSS
ncbi:hypothetical protein B0H63DRAFT_526718 [Podospora didyma]|uniref:Uncharacterized protein n=1 Tax=Podospora didyma TaxID=330526 RepID=A0AAE0KG03_9PEZI|nr:hypothetical protein B0H63DRAFT_526718 [Podospora didyma]